MNNKVQHTVPPIRVKSPEKVRNKPDKNEGYLVKLPLLTEFTVLPLHKENHTKKKKYLEIRK